MVDSEGSDHVVNIIGGGTDPVGADRKVKIWAEGGSEMTGSLSVTENKTWDDRIRRPQVQSDGMMLLKILKDMMVVSGDH